MAFTQVSYKREKAREERSKTSGSGCSDVYYFTWDHFNQMEFLDDKKRKKGMQKCSYGSL